MKQSLIIVTILSICISTLCHELSIPLNFRDAISDLNTKIYHQPRLKSIINEIPQPFNFDTQKFIENSLEKLLDNDNFLNISSDCLTQLEELYFGLQHKMEWSLRVLDSFGKIPSGLINGNMAWLGEYSECRNISANEGNWTGKYALLSKPLKTFDPQHAIENSGLKFGLCVPNKCSQHDIYEIINQTFTLIPESIREFLPFNPSINETYVAFKDDKILNLSAKITLAFLGSLVTIILLCTAYDFFKRYQYYVKFQELLSSSVVINSETDELISTTTPDLTQKDNLEESYRYSISHESLISQIVIAMSAYTNTKKLFKTSSGNSEEFKCLHAIRVLSLGWVILGHSYIFSFIFLDNMAAIQPILKRFSFLIVSNAFFSVDTFFFLSGFLTCFSFLRLIERQNGKITAFFILKFYLHRFWRLTPAYLIAFMISLFLSPYMGNGPLFPDEGFESPECKSQWWANVLYINNFYKADNFCFGISWFLANDFQFHIFAPLILIPLGLNKIFLAIGISIGLLATNVLLIVLNLYYKHIEAAQFGQNFKEFFMDYYIIPWFRMAPYIIGILYGYTVMVFKKRPIKISKFLNIIFWMITLLFTSVTVFGLYPDALGENPLARETRILYQSLSKLAWSIAVGYIIFSCVVISTDGIVNSILSWPIWVPLSRINYSAFLIHIMIIMTFNTTQEHLLHLQDLNMAFYFLAELVFTYSFAYLFNLFFEQPFVAIEKFLFKF